MTAIITEGLSVFNLPGKLRSRLDWPHHRAVLVVVVRVRGIPSVAHSPNFVYNSNMAKTPPSPFPFPPQRVYDGANVPRRVILRYARAIAEEIQPDAIILFGSYAYGTPQEDSDVDLLVVMPTGNPHNQAVRILWRLAAPFPIDLLVRTPQEMKWRLEEGESFTTTIMTKGKVLYEKDDARVGQKSRGRLRARQARQPKSAIRK